MKQNKTTTDIAARIVYELDQYARQYDESEYGLPVYSDTSEKEMIEIVKKLIE